MSKLTDWSFSQFKEFKNLHDASNFSNSSNLKKYYNFSTITIINLKYEELIHTNDKNFPNPNLFHKNINNILNINPLHILKNNNKKISADLEKPKFYLNYSSYNINIPFFNEGISNLKFLHNGKYFIVGNKNSQMFYIYENFPTSNLKYENEKPAKKNIFQNKIVYSIFRGITKGTINNIDLSTCGEFLVISSNKGTFHIFSIPKKNSQISENSSLFDYENFTEMNNKVSVANCIDKIKYSSFIDNCSNYIYKTSSVFVNMKIDLDLIDDEIKKKIVKKNITKKINKKFLITFSEYESSLNIHLIQQDEGSGEESIGNKNYILKNINIKEENNKNFIGNKEKVFLLKKIDLNESFIKFQSNNSNLNNTNAQIDKIKLNYKNLTLKNFKNIKLKSHYKQFIDLGTTTRNFPTLQTHPLFTFNKIKITNNINNLNNLNSINKNNFENLNKINSEILNPIKINQLNSQVNNSNSNQNNKFNIIDNYNSENLNNEKNSKEKESIKKIKIPKKNSDFSSGKNSSAHSFDSYLGKIRKKMDEKKIKYKSFENIDCNKSNDSNSSSKIYEKNFNNYKLEIREENIKNSNEKSERILNNIHIPKVESLENILNHKKNIINNNNINNININEIKISDTGKSLGNFFLKNESININNHKKSFDSSNINLNYSLTENKLTELFLIREIEYSPIKFEMKKKIQKSDFFMDNYIEPKLIINSSDAYRRKFSNLSRENNESFSERKHNTIYHKDNNINLSCSDTVSKENSLSINNVKENENMEIYNSNPKENILKIKINEDLNGNIMDKINFTNATVIKFCNEIKIDEDYMNKK